MFINIISLVGTTPFYPAVFKDLPVLSGKGSSPAADIGMAYPGNIG